MLTNTWPCICFFLKINEFIKWTIIFNVDMGKVLISYNIINVWFIQIIWFANFDMGINSVKYPILINVKKNSCFLLDDVNTITIYLLLKNSASVQSKLNFKIEKTFNVMCIERRLIVW